MDGPENHGISLGTEDIGEPDVLAGEPLISPNDALGALSRSSPNEGSPGPGKRTRNVPPPAVLRRRSRPRASVTLAFFATQARTRLRQRVALLPPPQPATSRSEQDAAQAGGPSTSRGDSMHAAICDKFRAAAPCGSRPGRRSLLERRARGPSRSKPSRAAGTRKRKVGRAGGRKRHPARRIFGPHRVTGPDGERPVWAAASLSPIPFPYRVDRVLREEEQVRRALGQPAHQVRVPVRPVRRGDEDAVPRGARGRAGSCGRTPKSIWSSIRSGPGAERKSVVDARLVVRRDRRERRPPRSSGRRAGRTRRRRRPSSDRPGRGGSLYAPLTMRRFGSSGSSDSRSSAVRYRYAWRTVPTLSCPASRRRR